MVNNNSRHKIGWVTYDSFPRYNFFWRRRTFRALDSFSRMRTGYIAEYINLHCPSFHNALYNPNGKYDLVVFQKMMDKRCQNELGKIKAYGGKVIFDANVNYYEIWGNYNIEGTKPSPQQQRDAIFMTQNADWVIADSSYIAAMAKKYACNVTIIPDNVNLNIYDCAKQHYKKNPLLIAWSGVAKKAQHLLLLKEVFKRLKGFKLLLVSEKFPPVIDELKNIIPCYYHKFSESRYAQKLKSCDVIISPKELNNGYEAGHTEYKITLGMAMGLPAIASPQQSYIEAISYKNSGIIASTPEEWHQAFTFLANDCKLRSEMGARARQTVIERYSTEAAAKKYLDVIQELVVK